MKKLLIAAALSLALVLPAALLGVVSVSAASPASHAAHISASSAAACPSYSKHCVPVPPTGVVNIICGGEHFIGTATPGSAITCTPLPLLAGKQCASQRAESVSIQGSGLDLTVPGAKLYRFDPSTGNSVLVPAITGTGGEYTKLYGTCAVPSVPVLPKTGGGAPMLQPPLTPGGPTLPVLPIGLGLLLVLMGIGMAAFRTRKSQV